MFLFSLGVRGNFCVLHVPNLLVGDVYHVKNEGFLFEVFMMRFFNRTLSIYRGLGVIFGVLQIFSGWMTKEKTVKTNLDVEFHFR